MKIGIFGSGNIYNKYKSKVEEHDEIEVIIDNNAELYGNKIDGHRVINPREVFDYEMAFVVLMSESADAMRKQLLEYGFPEDKIVHFKDYLGSLETEINIYRSSKAIEEYRGKILIITNNLGYTGGPIVALRTAKCATKLGYKATIAASGYGERFVKELNDAGIDVVIQEWLEHASQKNLNWTNSFEIVLVNTFAMVKCAISIARVRKTLIWIHENMDYYETMEYWHEYIQQGISSSNIDVYLVSQRAKQNFMNFYSYNRAIAILPVAIEDWYDGEKTNYVKENVKFAIVGNIIPRKGYDILLSAIKKIERWTTNECLLVGANSNDEYSNSVIKTINETTGCKYVGEKKLDEMKEILRSVDVVVVPSLEETFSMAAAEAMMMGKVCIVTNDCGVVDYIIDKTNGLVVRTGDISHLAEKMEWCISNKDQLCSIGRIARETYEKNFTMDVLQCNLARIIEEVSEFHE